VTDFLETKRGEIAARIKELEPLVDEYRTLEAAAAALAGLPGHAASEPHTPAKRSRTRAARGPATPPRRRGRPRGSGTRALQVIELVKAQPGITVAGLASAMGIRQNYLYRVLPRLVQEHKIVKAGKGWTLVEQ
jgi:hypothetical protein